VRYAGSRLQNRPGRRAIAVNNLVHGAVMRRPSLMLTARDPYSCELQSFSPYKMA